MNDLIPAVGYIRMSSDPQEQSPAQQRSELVELARQIGANILRWYVDEGKSGSKETAKRTDFLRMIQDSKVGDFRVILCWDLARFGRLDSLKSAAFKDVLRSNGVHLHTVKEGEIRWETLSDKVVDSIRQEMAYEYSKGLGRDSIRGRLDLLRSGQWPNGRIPYGYDKLYVAPDGQEFRVERLATFSKGRGWKRYLVVNDREAKVVRQLFRLFLEEDLSLREISRRIVGTRPDGKGSHWTKDTVKDTLANKIYAGFAHIGGGRTRRLRAKEAHNRAGYHEQAGAVPALVSLEDWEAAIAKLEKNRENRVSVKPNQASPLSGILFCGRCGYAMSKHSRSDRGGERYSYFTCSSTATRPSLGCKQWRVREADILPVVVKHLIACVDKAVLESSHIHPGDGEVDGHQEVDNVKAQLARLVKRLECAEADYLGSEPGPRKERQQLIIKQWEAEQVELERRLSNLTMAEGDLTKFARWWQSIRGELVSVVPDNGEPSHRSWENASGHVIEAGRPGYVMQASRFRALLKSLGMRVSLSWEPLVVMDKRTGQPRESERYYSLARADVTISGKQFTEHLLAGHTNRYSRARSPGTG